ncbi:MAG: hemerythrin domain-containing protein [Streptosporangiaceae bacterium]
MAAAYQSGTFPDPKDRGRRGQQDHGNKKAGMEISSLAVALEREHHQIDDGVAAFAAAPGDLQPLARTIGALRRHIYLEEEFLFPLLRQAEPGLAAPVFVMLREHAQIWATLDSLERELDAGTGTGLALCRQLAVRLLHHNLKEEKILYPRADDALPPAAAEGLRAFLDSGDLPEGWVCLMKARSAQQSPGRAGR